MSDLSSQISRLGKRNFSSFTYAEAFKQLQITELIPWNLDVPALEPSGFFQERIQRLQLLFNLQGYEEAKKLLIDAICEEAILPCDHLRIWKGAQLESDAVVGYVDYLIAQRRGYLETPLLCIIEAKKDNFEQGLAQCLVEMQACQWQNQQAGRGIDILGIVTNGEGWQFYRLITSSEAQEPTSAQVYGTPLYSVGDMQLLLGRLRHIFQLCEQNLLIPVDPD